jgi:hypothetical protein
VVAEAVVVIQGAKAAIKATVKEAVAVKDVKAATKVTVKEAAPQVVVVSAISRANALTAKDAEDFKFS